MEQFKCMLDKQDVFFSHLLVVLVVEESLAVYVSAVYYGVEQEVEPRMKL